MEEYWVEIPGYPKYAVSNTGYIMNVRSQRLLKLRDNGGGYYRVVLNNIQGPRAFYVHRLVALCFLDSYRDHLHVQHINGDKSNNHVNNLQLRGGDRAKATGPISSRSDWGARVEIIETGEIFRSVRDCANWIGGDYGAIYACLRGERMRHLGYTFRYYEELA